MLIEQPPAIFRLLCPGAFFRGDRHRRTVYLTFDDGPVPEVTPQVLDILDTYGVKATFFMVGDNVRRHPQLLQEVLRRGHRVGNHTMHHVQGMHCPIRGYMRDVLEAAAWIKTDLFRPPHGWLTPAQLRALKKHYRVVMYDVVTRDYSRMLTAEQVLENVRRYTRPGSVIVFHDSLKSAPRMLQALPKALQWLSDKGYATELL